MFTRSSYGLRWSSHFRSCSIGNPPRITSGGNGKPFFGGCRVKIVGLIIQGIPTDDTWSFGLRRRFALAPTSFGLEDRDVWRLDSLQRLFFEVWECPPRRLRVTSSPGASLHPVRNRRCIRLIAESVYPSDHVGESFGTPLNQPRGRPFSSPPRRATVSRRPARPVRPLS
jgi:hypothetical protein